MEDLCSYAKITSHLKFLEIWQRFNLTGIPTPDRADTPNKPHSAAIVSRSLAAEVPIPIHA